MCGAFAGQVARFARTLRFSGNVIFDEFAANVKRLCFTALQLYDTPASTQASSTSRNLSVKHSKRNALLQRMGHALHPD
jgi:hypothetical protein